MLNTLPIRKSLGFSLIELMVGIAIFALAMSFGISSYRVWIKNTQIRTAAESIQNGLQRARSEAIKNNANVFFTLQANSGWTVASGVPPVLPIDFRSGTDGSKNVTSNGFDSSNAAATTITFSNLGMVISNAATLRRIEVDSNILSAADSRNLRVRIGTAAGVGSTIMMCDPNLTAGIAGACS